MCGIAGFYGFRDDNLIKKFSEQLSHRGPDGVGFFINDKVSLLNRRLAIIDRKGGDQPIFNEDNSVVVTYNGEIYNFKELQKNLSAKGHIFKTKSDTEVIVHGYEEWGDSCFDKFNGMFGIALYDIKRQKLVLARDHFGIKPVYFSILGPVIPNSFRNLKEILNQVQDDIKENLRVIFSSEIKPLIYSGFIEKKPNDRIIFRYLRYRIHDDQRETFFKGIYRLMPGEMMVIQNDKYQISKYTNLEEELRTMVETRHGVSLRKKDIEIFKEKLIEAIKLRLISEVPVGTCLSGGLDSSTVVSVVNKLLNERVKEAKSVGKIQNTFSAVFPNSSNNEEKYIDSLKSQIPNLKSHKIYPKPEEFFKEIEDFVRTQEEPTISTGPYAQYKVMQEAQKYVTVLLDGQGADEMMAGYTPYYFIYLKQLWQERKMLEFFKEISSSLDIITNASINRLIEAVGVKKVINPNKLLNKVFVSKNNDDKFITIGDNLKKRLVEDIFSNSLPALLRYEDRNAMRFSIEGRVPFLDFNLLRYLFSLPDDAIIKNGWNKYILKQSIKDLLPGLILKRRNKIGFTTPESDWFMRMKNKIYSVFLSESFARRPYFNQGAVLGAFQKFIEGKNSDTMLFWRLLNLEIWMRILIDKPVKELTGSRVNELGANKGKKLNIKIDSKEYLRFPIKTEIFKKGDDLVTKIVKLLNGFLVKKGKGVLDQVQDNPQIKEDAGWFLVISEKIVAIAQGRSYFIWDIKTGFWANLLAKFVKKTPSGIGLGSPWTMQLAINEVGLPKIILATIVSGLTKPFGISGLFYKIAGKEVASIDGPTEYSLYPSNVSAKLGPKDPQKEAEQIHKKILEIKNSSSQFFITRESHHSDYVGMVPSKVKKIAYDSFLNNFLGVAIIDANDLGQNVLGNSTNLSDNLIEKIFSDNPMGQADEQTPLALVFAEKSSIISA